MKAKMMDEAKAEAFGDRLLGVLNSGGLALMISIGHRTGLFDTMAEMEPGTSEAIAGEAGLNERYVREWLGAMVVGRVVEYDPATAAYSLPPEHGALLTRAAAPDNMAAFMQYIPLLGTVEDQVVECFKKGGGVPYSAVPRFQEVMAEDSGQTVLPVLVDLILPLAPDLPERLAGGIDVLDIGCGAGRALNLMALAFPASRFTGYDFSELGIALAREQAAESGAANLTFEVKDVTALGESEQYDLITAFDAIHDQAHPDKVLGEIAAALRPDGVFLMQDIRASSHLHLNMEHPAGTFLYAISCMH